MSLERAHDPEVAGHEPGHEQPELSIEKAIVCAAGIAEQCDQHCAAGQRHHEKTQDSFGVEPPDPRQYGHIAAHARLPRVGDGLALAQLGAEGGIEFR